MIPPRTVIRVKCIAPDWDSDLRIGDTFRIGYYSKQDGLNCVWLVNAEGEYQETWDQESLLDWFEVIETSDETDFYGDDRSPLRTLHHD